MADNTESIHRYYRAFAALDAAAMADCYAQDARFQDPVFSLVGKREIAGMWAMLCDAVRQNGRADWSLAYSDVRGAGDAGSAHWEARYRFSATGRLVENRIEARMRFNAAGLIIDHVDCFDFWRWSRQALGPPGLLLGWSPLLRAKVRAQAAARLQRFLARPSQ